MRYALPIVLAVALSAVVSVPGWGESPMAGKQFFEIRTYRLGENGDAETLDKYLGEALLPALSRMGVGPVGAFGKIESDDNTDQQPVVILVLPLADLAQLADSRSKLQTDTAYRAAAKAYLDRGPKDRVYERISSELLVGMKSMNGLAFPDAAIASDDRVYEFRLYESPNERLGDLKVHMFDNGEVDIFLDCGINPLVLGQGLAGPQTPNLSYLTVYPNEAKRKEAWDAFRSHPNWQVLKGVAKYKGTVSKIEKHILRAKPYSQF